MSIAVRADLGPYSAVAFEGQTVIVVGGAQGIGRSAARLVAARGARVVCADRDLEGATAVAEEINGQGGSCTAAYLDVTDAGSVSSAVEEHIRSHGRVHGVVNTAGITGRTGANSDSIDLTDFDRVLAVNLRGAFVVSKAVLPHMVANGYGRLLHLASIAGKEGNAGMVSYSASKAGLIGMVKAMGKEYARTGVTVNALAPAVIRTAMVDAMPPEQVEYMTTRIPMERCGTLDEAAEMIAWILSPAASFTTGFTFDLSGGRAVY